MILDYSNIYEYIETFLAEKIGIDPAKLVLFVYGGYQHPNAHIIKSRISSSKITTWESYRLEDGNFIVDFIDKCWRNDCGCFDYTFSLCSICKIALCKKHNFHKCMCDIGLLINNPN